MYKFVNKILREAEEDDSFFQPKNQRRDKKAGEWKKGFLSKIELGFQNIRRDYKNKDWDSKEGELFLQIFSKLHVNKKYSEYWKGYVLKNKNNKIMCVLNLKNDIFRISYEYIWSIFMHELSWQYYDVQLFMKDMLDKYFKLYEFTALDLEENVYYN